MRADTHHGPEQCSTSETEYIDAALTIVALEIPLATHGRAIHGTMTPQPNARQNTRIRDRRRFGTAPTRGSFRCRGRFDAPSWTGRRIILGIGAMSVPGSRPEVEGRAPK